MNNFQEIIDKSVDESRIQIANTAGHLAVAHESFANEYLLEVANQVLFMLGSNMTKGDFKKELDGLKNHLLNSLNGESE